VAEALPLLQDRLASYVHGPGGQILEQIAGSTATYYHADQLGSVRALTNQSKAVVATYSYDAYGQPTVSTGSVTNPFRYAGEYQDSESGRYYLRARYYDPATQQFLTVDPLLAATEQAYAYAAGSPINATDPSGLCPPDLNSSECIEFMEGGGGGGARRAQDAGVEVSASGAWAITGNSYDYSSGEPEPVVANGEPCPEPVTAGQAGRFSELEAKAVKGDDLTPHHMPQARQNYTSRGEGGALMLPRLEHVLTRTFGIRGAITYRSEMGLPFRTVLARDMFDIVKLFGGKYNSGLRDLLGYYRSNYPDLIRK
jgi:RHS repeat-associated protein